MGLDTMPEQAVRSKAVITATAAELFVSDIKTSCDFFTQKLGFAIVFVYRRASVLCSGEAR